MKVSRQVIQLLGLSLFCGTAGAVPSLVLTGIWPGDISPDKTTTVGYFYDSTRNITPVMRYTVGGQLLDTQQAFRDGSMHMSADGTTIIYGDYNVENINNAANSIVYANGITPQATSIAHVWNATLGAMNLGCASNANRCDYNINNAYAMSANGRYVAVAGWTNSLCGTMRTWRVDRQGSGASAWSVLPLSFSGPPASAFATSTIAVAMSDDGSVLVGYDQNYNAAQSQVVRRPAVWVRNAANTAWTQTILDTDGGQAYGVSGDGTVVVGKDRNYNAARWVRTGNTWSAANNMGAGAQVAYFASSDGSTVFGDSFVWRADLNGGVAMNLQTYLESLGMDFTSTHLAVGAFGGSPVRGISSDARAISLATVNTNNPCLTVAAPGILYLDGHDCVAPSFVFPLTNDTHIQIGRTGYYAFGTGFNCPVAGTWPMTWQWQKWDSVNGVWADMVDDVPCPSAYGQANFNVIGSQGIQLRVGFENEVLLGDLSWRGRFRCVCTNSCGTATTDWAILNTCSADYNCDGISDFFDYLDFVADFTSNAPFADFNRDSAIDFFDYLDFVDAFSQGC